MVALADLTKLSEDRRWGDDLTPKAEHRKCIYTV